MQTSRDFKTIPKESKKAILSKARKHNKAVLPVTPHKSSQECHNCEHINESTRSTLRQSTFCLSQAEFYCQACGPNTPTKTGTGTVHADYNASMVIKKRTFQQLQHHRQQACQPSRLRNWVDSKGEYLFTNNQTQSPLQHQCWSLQTYNNKYKR